MTKEDIDKLIKDYFDKDGFSFPGEEFGEYRVDPYSMKILYSLVRRHKPKSVVDLGTSVGGTSYSILGALLKNKGKFKFVGSELHDDIRTRAIENCKRFLNYEPKIVGDLTKNLKHFPKEIDFLMHDTDHDLETTKYVFKHIIPRVKKGSIVVFHDWAVYEEDGKWLGKGDGGVGGWPETEYMLELQRKGKLPLKKVFFTYRNPRGEETGVFTKK